MKLSAVVFITGLTLITTDYAVGRETIANELRSAKKDYAESVTEARDVVLAGLKKKMEAARKMGDLETLVQLEKENEEFDSKGAIPSSVSVGRFTSKIDLAQSRLINAYKNAIKESTKKGNITFAKSLQEELESYESRNPYLPLMWKDSFQVDSIWADDVNSKTLTVTEREGNSFKANLRISNRIERLVSGTIKNNEITWLRKDVQPIKGGQGDDNTGTIASDEFGERIDFTWQSSRGQKEQYTLRLKIP
jgi:hypothetical protein